jgi:hypothetical protein
LEIKKRLEKRDEISTASARHFFFSKQNGGGGGGGGQYEHCAAMPSQIEANEGKFGSGMLVGDVAAAAAAVVVVAADKMPIMGVRLVVQKWYQKRGRVDDGVNV